MTTAATASWGGEAAAGRTDDAGEDDAGCPLSPHYPVEQKAFELAAATTGKEQQRQPSLECSHLGYSPAVKRKI